MCGLLLGLLTSPHHVSPILLVLPVYCGVCVVCTLTSQEVLYEAVFSLCLDACGTSYCCNAELPYHPKYLRGTHLVSKQLEITDFVSEI